MSITMIMHTRAALTILTCFTILTACGSGGDGAVAPAVIPPILVNAGQNISVPEQTEVALSGNATGGDGALSYTWSISPDVPVTDTDQTDTLASLMSPLVISNTIYQVTLTATDAAGTQASDTISMTVIASNTPPTAIIDVTQDELYLPNQFPILSTIQLDASQSFDIDPQSDAVNEVTYAWQQTSGINVLADNPIDQATLQFDAPLSASTQTIEILLTVTDQEGAIDTASATLMLLGVNQTLPAVTAGKPLTVFSGEKINLSAMARSEAPNAEPFLFSWSQIGAEPMLTMPIDFDNPSINNTFAIAPEVDEVTTISFEIDVTDRFGNRTQDSVEMTVLPTTNVWLNDTGVTLDANETSNSAVYQAQYAGQDGHRGKDAVSENGLSIKAGRGEQGFDFTRLNQNGDEVDDLTQPWRCVRDNVTGLVWENKTNDDSTDLHYSEQTFTWFSEGENGDFEGHINPSSTQCNLASGNCNTQAFTEAVNEEGLCGFFDWRLPSHSELMSIIHYGKTRSPLLDTDYFPFAGPAQQPQLWYWTLQPSIDGVTESGAQNAWAFNFANGVDNFLNKATQQRARLVRAGR